MGDFVNRALNEKAKTTRLYSLLENRRRMTISIQAEGCRIPLCVAVGAMLAMVARADCATATHQRRSERYPDLRIRVYRQTQRPANLRSNDGRWLTTLIPTSSEGHHLNALQGVLQLRLSGWHLGPIWKPLKLSSTPWCSITSYFLPPELHGSNK